MQCDLCRGLYVYDLSLAGRFDSMSHGRISLPAPYKVWGEASIS